MRLNDIANIRNIRKLQEIKEQQTLDYRNKNVNSHHLNSSLEEARSLPLRKAGMQLQLYLVANLLIDAGCNHTAPPITSSIFIGSRSCHDCCNTFQGCFSLPLAIRGLHQCQWLTFPLYCNAMYSYSHSMRKI